MLKKLLKVLLALTLLIALVVIGLALFINTGQYRSALETAVANATGYELNIAGDIELDLFPELGLTLNDVRLRNPASPQELASTSAISLRVDRGLLFRGQLLIQELLANDFHINYYVDASGSNLWAVAREEAVEAAPPAEEDGETVSISFERILVENASVDYQDLSQGSRYRIGDLRLDSRDTNIEGRPFSLDLSFTYDDGISSAVPMGLRGDVVADIDNGSLTFNDVNFNVTPLLLSGQLEVANLNEAMTFNGSFESNSFDTIGLLQTLGLSEAEEEFSGSVDTGQAMQFEFEFRGDQTQLVLETFTGSLGSTTIEGDGDLRFATQFAPTSIRYEFITNGIDLTPFLMGPDTESSDETEVVPPPPIASTTNPPATPLPTELLNSINVLGSIVIESISADELQVQDINLFTNVENGVLDIEMQPAAAYGGTMQGSVRLDGRNPDAALTAQLMLQQLNISEFRESVSRLNSVTGNLNAQASYTSVGSTVEDLLEALSGTMSFDITETSVDIGLIKQVFTAIAALSPAGEAIQQWPDVIQFGTLAGQLLLDDGLAQNQQVNLRMDNFDVTGTGGINLAAGSFDYDLDFTLLGPPERQTIPINPRYHGVPWPVQCEAAFADPVSQYCSPDFARVREIFAELGRNALQNRLQEEITDQVPEELEDAARGILRQILN